MCNPPNTGPHPIPLPCEGRGGVVVTPPPWFPIWGQPCTGFILPPLLVQNPPPPKSQQFFGHSWFSHTDYAETCAPLSPFTRHLSHHHLTPSFILSPHP